MKPFDINIHLPCRSHLLSDRLAEDVSMDGPWLTDCFEHHLQAIREHSQGANFMLFNQSLDAEEAVAFTSRVRQDIPNARFTLLADPGVLTSISELGKMKSAGIDAIKYHCYVQEISEEAYPAAIVLAEHAEQLGMPVFIDTSFGSTKMYRYDNLRLAAALLDQVTAVPVILLHSGGARAMEAMLLAESAPNVFLDMSFSVPYYLGSRVEQDLSFAYKQIGSDRVLYGSDYPYISFDQSMGAAMSFFERSGFPESDRTAILSTTAQRLFRWRVS